MRAGRKLIAGALALAGVVVVVVAAALTIGDDEPPRPKPVTSEPYSPRLTSRPKSREAAAAETDRRARRIIDRDPTLAAVLKGNRYRLREVAPWIGLAEIGLVAMIDPEKPLSGTAVLPYLCGGDPNQGGGRILWRLDGAERLDVLLRFADMRALQISPTSRRYDEPMPPQVRRLEILPGSDRCPPSEH